MYTGVHADHRARACRSLWGGRRGVAPHRCARHRTSCIRAHAQLRCLVFDCDGVILESEDLHRRAYNAAFQFFAVHCGGQPVNWSEEFYDELQNTVGGGKQKMRWFFQREGWPRSQVLAGTPETDEERIFLVDKLQAWKSTKYQELIGSGTVQPRPGVERLMDEAKREGMKVGVCSAATKESVIYTLQHLLGKQRFLQLDCFMAGDDVPRKKPDPIIYKLAAQRMGVDPSECMVIEDSAIGVQAAVGAGMRVTVTYTPSTKSQEFAGAERIVSNLGDSAQTGISVKDLLYPRATIDDRAAQKTFW